MSPILRPILAATLMACAATSLVRADERVLFAFDDNSLPWQHNLKLTLVQAEKYAGNPVLKKGQRGSADAGHAVLYGTVIKDGDKFRMWYLGMLQSTLEENGQAADWFRPMCYAESKDGIHWDKPSLGLVDIKGSKNNNACLIEGSPYSLTRIDDFLAVLFEPQDPNPDRRYKAVFIAHLPYDDIHGGMSGIGKKEKRVCSLVCAVSADGLKWKVIGDRPANAGGERYEVSSVYHFGNFYYATGQLLSPWAWRPDGSDIGRALFVYRSPDFDSWSQAKAFGFARPGQIVNPPKAGEQNHMGAGMWNRGNVVVGLYGMWQDAPAFTEKRSPLTNLKGTHIDLGLIVSNDGFHFREPVPNFKIIPRGGPKDWDHVATLQGNAFVNEGDKTMIWYSHWDTGGTLDNMEIGLATMRRDGFGYLSRKQSDVDGLVETCTLEAHHHHPRKLLVNADGVSAASPLTIELVDAFNRPLPEYSGKNAASLTTSGTRTAVVWPSTGSDKMPLGKAVGVHVHFPVAGDVKLYSLNIVQ